jgi:hypothetical protein
MGRATAGGRMSSGQAARCRRYKIWVDTQGEEKLQFEVNGQDYFLNFVEDERRWFVFAPSLTGLQRIPVYVDGPDLERISVLDKARQNRPI